MAIVSTLGNPEFYSATSLKQSCVEHSSRSHEQCSKSSLVIRSLRPLALTLFHLCSRDSNWTFPKGSATASAVSIQWMSKFGSGRTEEGIRSSNAIDLSFWLSHSTRRNCSNYCPVSKSDNENDIRKTSQHSHQVSEIGVRNQKQCYLYILAPQGIGILKNPKFYPDSVHISLKVLT